MGAAIPATSYEYAETVLSRNIDLQAGTASYLANGALTALSVLLAVVALLMSYAAQKGSLPTANFLYAAIALVIVSGIMLGAAWFSALLYAETNPLGVARELLFSGQPVPAVRQNVVKSMIETYSKRKFSLSIATRLLGPALVVAAVGLSLFKYGLAQ
jgi:hypothetical protein